jgi:hypothetical protein
MTDTSSLLIGGAIGFISAVLAPIVVEPVKHCVFGPKLKVEFIEGDRGFITDTKETGGTDAHYVRVKVLNTGRQIAKQCRAYLVNVEKWNTSTGKFAPTIYCDSLQLAWSARANTEEAYRPLDLPRDINQFIDIVSTRRPESGYKVMTNPHLYRYEPLFKEHGKFRYTVLVSGDNVKPVSVQVVFEWSGDWHNFAVSAGS